MWKPCYICFILSCIFSYVHAQEPLIIKGKITDSSRPGLPEATIHIYTGTDTIQGVAMADGNFSLRIPRVSSFIVVVTMKGFAECKKPYSFKQIRRSPIIL